MSEVLERFKEAAQRKDWKAAYEYCNGLNMYEMLRGLDSLGPTLLNSMRAQMPIFAVWGGPNMPRIKYAMDVVQFRKLPADVPGDLKATGQVQDAINFLAARKPAAAPKKMLKVVLFWTTAAQGESLSTRLVQKAQDFLLRNGDRFTLHVRPERTVLPFQGDVLDKVETDQVRELAERAVHFGADRLPVIFFTFTPAACRPGSNCPAPPFGFTPRDARGKAFVMINTSIAPAPDNVTLLHEIGHAAGIEPSDTREGDLNNFMSNGNNRSVIREDQLKKLSNAYFATK